MFHIPKILSRGCPCLSLWLLPLLVSLFCLEPVIASQPVPAKLKHVLMVAGQPDPRLRGKDDPVLFDLIGLGNVLRSAYDCEDVQILYGEKASHRNLLKTLSKWRTKAAQDPSGWSLLVYCGTFSLQRNTWTWLLPRGKIPGDIRPLQLEELQQSLQMDERRPANLLIISSAPLGDGLGNARMAIPPYDYTNKAFSPIFLFPANYAAAMFRDNNTQHFAFMRELINFLSWSSQSVFNLNALFAWLNREETAFRMQVSVFGKQTTLQHGPVFRRVRKMSLATGTAFLNANLTGEFFVDGLYVGQVNSGYRYPVRNLSLGRHLFIVRAGGTYWRQWFDLTKEGIQRPPVIHTPAEQGRPPVVAAVKPPPKRPPAVPTVKMPEHSHSAPPVVSTPKAKPAPKKPQKKSPPALFTIPGTSISMRQVPAGSFSMGSKNVPVASPEHTVVLSKPFWMSISEISQQDYYHVMDKEKSLSPETALLPISGITWFEAVEFCSRLNQRLQQALPTLPQGYEVRLPTEAEWEYVCRAG
ncbi:MAG: hypothetical protein D6820_06705, partial [Lentisphaerae bacterium]